MDCARIATLLTFDKKASLLLNLFRQQQKIFIQGPLIAAKRCHYF